MALTSSQEAVHERLNEQITQRYEAAKRDADAKGLKHPPAPVLLTAQQIEFPKYLFKEWKKSEKSTEHYVASQKRLVHNAEEEAVARKEGFSDSPDRKK